MIMAAVAIFKALIWVGVGIGKFLIDIGVRNILDTKIKWAGNMLVPACFVALLKWIECWNGLKSAHRETVTE